jgi:hypothetical protein
MGTARRRSSKPEAASWLFMTLEIKEKYETDHNTQIEQRSG